MASGELRERVFEANRRIVEAGLVVLTFGNASAADRAAGVMAIKPSGVPYDELGPDSMVVVDLESGVVREGSARPSSDTRVVASRATGASLAPVMVMVSVVVDVSPSPSVIV